jgi:P-type Ca2+ transporter type 2C
MEDSVNVSMWSEEVFIQNLPTLHLMICVLVPGDAPLAALRLLWVNMIMDTLGLLALATEPPDDNLMKKKSPIRKTGKFITNVM